MGEESSNYYIDFAQSLSKLFRGTKGKKRYTENIYVKKSGRKKLRVSRRIEIAITKREEQRERKKRREAKGRENGGRYSIR